MYCGVGNVVLVFMTAILMACGGGGGSSNTDGSNDGLIEYGPAARYSFDETEGVTAINSGFDDFHGEIVGAARVQGKAGNALDFSSIDGAHVLLDICCEAHPDTGAGAMWVTFPDNSFTIATWLKPTAILMDTI